MHWQGWLNHTAIVPRQADQPACRIASLMKQITAREFEETVAAKPAWATTLTEPVEIVGHCKLYRSLITHLSPLLHFLGEGPDEVDVAEFQDCRKLKVAEGTFHCCVWFRECRIEKIGQLTVTQPGYNGAAASFTDCKRLKIAEGTYPGHVDFSGSGIKRIEGRVITGVDPNEHAAEFTNCHQLRVAQGTYPGSVCFDDSGIRRIGNLHILRPDHYGGAATFARCDFLAVADGTFPGSVDFSGSGIERIGNLIITQPDELGEAANYSFCRRLKIATGNYPGAVDFSDSGIRAVRRLKATSAKFEDTLNLEDVPHGFLDNQNIQLDPDTLARLREIEGKRAAAQKAIKSTPTIEI